MSAGAHTATLLEWARKLQAIAQNGLSFSRDPFDRERYTELQELAAEMLSVELEIPAVRARAFWEGERGYARPKSTCAAASSTAIRCCWCANAAMAAGLCRAAGWT